MDIRSVLKQKFGFEDFRGQQQAVIEALLEQRSALLVMPTGGGKSLCFQLPTLMQDGLAAGPARPLTLVVSPLIALMKDQVDRARELGISAATINSTQTSEERQKVLNKLASGALQILFVTPERFRKFEFKQQLLHQKVSLFVVDEAHCISQWGHDFRPDYTRLGEIRKELGEPVTLALTATATHSVQKDILKQLHLADSTLVFLDGVDRPNLSLRCLDVHGTDAKVRALVALFHQIPGAKIVYFSLIDTLEKVSYQLRRLQISHGTYHGQMSAQDRQRSQNHFLNSDDAILLATPAFGLGIDKPNVRAVFHGEIPGSIEAYYQEVGRAGRDGLPAEGVLLYDPDDVSIQMDFLKWSNPDPEFIKSVYHTLANHLARVRQEGVSFLRDQLHFYHSRDFRLETSLNLLERYGFITGESPETWQPIEAPSGALVDPQRYEERLKSQQKQLLQMVQLTKSKDIKQTVVEYLQSEGEISIHPVVD